MKGVRLEMKKDRREGEKGFGIERVMVWVMIWAGDLERSNGYQVFLGGRLGRTQ